MSTAPVPTQDPLVPAVRHAFGWSLTVALLLTLAGILAIIAPIVSGLAITVIIGWFFAVVGFLHFLFAWKSHSTSGVFWELLLGFLYVFSGFYLIMHPLFGLASLTLFLGAYFLVKGIVQIIHFVQLQPRHGSWWLLFDGIICLILAVLIWKSWPSSSAWVIGTLVGISLLFSGFSRLMLTLTARRILTAEPARI
jgi:uncharacterized membrane protein HdeD (DUF308 family)